MELYKCTHCGKEHKNQAGQKYFFCSRDCMRLYWSMNFSGENHPNYRGGKISKPCAFCGNDFFEFPKEMESRKYCSKVCLGKSVANRPGNNTFINRAITLVAVSCGQCKKDLNLPPSRIRNSKSGNVFCSKQCQYDWMSDNQTRDKAPTWKGGNPQPKYPSKFNDKLKSIIRERDGDICKGCGKTNKEELQELNKRLCIHHIDYNRQNIEHKNLITVCTSCNVKANTRAQREHWIDFYSKISA